jgi:Asp-tRNA(Asn)/Glu-tRNA(Gln) amidotransferase A subunit family amidase
MNDELTWMPAWRIRELIVERDVSALEVTDHFLTRIEEFDPVLKAFKHVDAEGRGDKRHSPMLNAAKIPVHCMGFPFRSRSTSR